MTVPNREVAEHGTRPTSPEELLRSLDQLERQPLDVQVELLDAVRRGLDAVLGRPAEPEPRE